jgi:glycosyltransferase involved in cell wall biosynthesis
LKLLYILPEYLPDSGGGIITFYGQLLPALVQAGHEVKVVVANHQSLDKPVREIQGVRIEYLKSHFVEKARLGCQKFNATFWAFMPIAWGAYEQMHGGEGYDIVESTDWMALYMPWVVSERKARVVVSLHGSSGQLDWYSNPETSHFDGDIVRLAEVASLGLADAIHANSRSNAQFWESKIHKSIRVIPPFMEIPNRVTQCEESQRGLVVGRLQNLKGAEVLCRALQGISDIEIDWIGGDTQWNKTLKASEFIKTNYSNVFGSKLRWLGPKNYASTQENLQCAKFVVVPSTWDVFNLAAAEAMSYGVPIICSRNAGAEMLIEHGVNGFLFDPAKPEELADCLRKIIRIPPNELQDIGENGRRAISERMNKKCILDELEDSYNKLLKSPQTFRVDPWTQSFLRLVDSQKINNKSNRIIELFKKYIFRIGVSTCKN